MSATTVIAERSDVTLKGDYCIYCSASGVTVNTCTCRRAKQDQRMFSSPTGAVVTLKSLGLCPDCRMPLTPLDIDKKLQVVCPGCGRSEDYTNVKARLEQ
jgi:hypothetical protein